MKIKNPQFLKSIHELKCTVTRCFNKAEPHHIISRKAGGGDEPSNILPLCRLHHSECHYGLVKFSDKYPEIVVWLKENGAIDILDKRRSKYGRIG